MSNIFKHVLWIACLVQINSLSAKNFNTILRGNNAKQYVYNAAEVHIDKQTHAPALIKFDLDQAPLANNLIRLLKQWYDLDDNYDFGLIRIDKDHLGFEHHRFQQKYQGYEVKNMVVYVHIKNGKVHMVNGQLETRFTKTFNYSMQFLNALNIAKKHIGATSYKWHIPQEEWLLSTHKNEKKSTHFPNRKLVIAPQNWNIEQVDSYQLCYELDMFAHEPETRNVVYINANNGQIVLDESLIRHADAEATAQTKRSGTRTIQTDNAIIPGYFVLSESGRGNGIVTLDANGNHFRDEDNNWTLLEFDNAARDYAAVDAHWAAEVTYDYFKEKHNRNSYDDNGARIQCRVHRVFKGGDTNNATWNGSYISVGDATRFPYTFATLDIIAHEFVHAITDNTAGLIYVQEPGALNESFSDIFGTAIEFYGKPPNQNGNWLIGEDTGFSLRNMSNPNAKRDPDTYGNNDPHWINTVGCFPTTNNDLCGLHVNSNVQNFWFYLLSNGGNGTNHNGERYSVLGIGIDKAADIAYRNLTTYLTPNSDYEDAKTFAIQAAVDLYGDCPPAPEVISTINAWHAVGLGEKYNAANILQPNLTTIHPLTYCSAPQTIQFEGISTLPVNSYRWDFGDGNSSAQQNPTHTYTASGNYTVSLQVKGCDNTNTITKNTYIQIDDQSPCVTTMPFNSSLIETACSGTLYDYGGPNGAYVDQSEGTLTIVSPNNQPITLIFTEVGYELNYDYLYIYDGDSENDQLLWTLNGTLVPPPITSSGGSITLKHDSDTYVVDKGFALTWSSAGDCDFSCADVEIQISSSAERPSCSGNADGHIINEITGGMGPYVYQWSSGETSLNLNNKRAGDYTLSVTDKNQCSYTKTITVPPSNLVLTNTAEISDETCVDENDGSISIADINNGTPPYQINWSNGGTGNTITNLGAGIFSATITDKNGCSVFNEYELHPATGLQVTKDISSASGNRVPDGSIVVRVEGGMPPYSYYWSNGTTNSSVNNLFVGNYWVSITDAAGCNLLENYTVTSSCPATLSHMNNASISSGLQTAGESITSNTKITVGKVIRFKAGKTINLINDFEVEKGASFSAEIGSCN